MISPLVQFLPLSEKRPTDIIVRCGSFTTTTSQVEPVTPAGRQLFAECFGSCASSANFSKTKGIDFGTFCEQKGLGVEFSSEEPKTF